MSYESDYDEEEELALDLDMLREDLVTELQALSQYQEHIDTIEDEEAVRVLEQIRDDKKDHIAALLSLIQRLDPAQAEKFRKWGL
jgi:hypothetical protein